MATSSSTFRGREIENVRKSLKNINGGIDSDDVETDSDKKEREMQTFSPNMNRKSSRLQRKSTQLENSNMNKESIKEVKEFVKKLPASKKGPKKANLSAKEKLDVDVNHQEIDAMKDISESGTESPRSMRGQKRTYEETVNVNAVDKSLTIKVENNTEDDAPNDADAKSPPKQNKKRKKGRAKYAPDPKDLPPDITEQISNMPEGWIRKVTVRKSGKTAGQVDVYITNPEGKTFRSMPDIAIYLVRTKSEFKLDNFSFSRKPYENMSLSKIEDAAALETVVKVEPSE